MINVLFDVILKKSQRSEVDQMTIINHQSSLVTRPHSALMKTVTLIILLNRSLCDIPSAATKDSQQEVQLSLSLS